MTPRLAGRRGAEGRDRRATARVAALVLAQVVLAAAACLGQAPAVARAATATIRGMVVDSAGAPVAGVTVSVLPAGTPGAVSDDSGRFTVEHVPVGPVRLAARRLGYAPVAMTVELPASGLDSVRVQMQATAFLLDTVTITDSLGDQWLSTFNRRRSRGNGYFLTRADIERLRPHTTADLLRHLPGLRIEHGTWGTRVLFMRGGVGAQPCAPQLFVHGMTYSGTVDDFLPNDIEAIEVYVGISTVPVELQTARAHTCGAIVFWMRRP